MSPLYNFVRLIPNYGVFTDSKFVFNVYVTPSNLLVVLYFLKQHQMYRFTVLSTISCVDYPSLALRFELTYTLMSIDFPCILNVKLKVSEFSNIYSSSIYFKSAVWLEREVWDMFGVYFINNLDLRRILTDYGFPYHPLRKTFPLQGFFMVSYNFVKKKIYYGQVKSGQVKPHKHLLTPWQII